jgi:3-hydroxyisobutyrate dehydrogenase-like beta-hydroxyacid dehydrogenase
MFCLPSGDHVTELVSGGGQLLASCRPGQVFIDLGTTPVSLTRELQRQFSERGAHFADSPVTRTRQAAQAGTLSTLFGGPTELFDMVSPLLGCFCSDITQCGETGTGQVVKQMNNMILFQTVVAIAEGLTTARAAGLDDEVFFDALSKGSGDSFALRNHGLKAMKPGEFPERAFSTRYALKDLSYASELASQHGVTLHGAENVRSMFEKAIENGDGERYFPVLINSIARRSQ